MTAYRTANDLKDNAKQASIGALNRLLTTSIDLALATKHAHWNIKGPNFIALHEMIDGFRTQLDGHIDTMAERIVQLGGMATGTLQDVAQASVLAPYPARITSQNDHLPALVERFAKLASIVRAGIDETAAAGDADTADILTGTSRDLDKALWFLEAHLQG